VVDDFSDVKKKEEDLKEKMIRDPLTRAYNRNVLDTLLKDKLTKARKDGMICSFAVLDIDDFKNINDTYGHKTGDSVLKYVASKIKQDLSESDLLVRTGGDEFLLYLHNTNSRDNAETKISSIFDHLSENAEADLGIAVRCSIGVSMFPVNGTTVETLTARADEALYKVKKNGKSGYCFSDIA
jgi:diguanylate cyclase (GGDEF)-like protein